MTVLLGLIVVEPVDCQRCMSAVLWPRENKTETSDSLRVLKGPIELSVPMSTFWHKIRVGLLYFVRIHSCAFGTQLTGLLDVSICLFLCHNWCTWHAAIWYLMYRPIAATTFIFREKKQKILNRLQWRHHDFARRGGTKRHGNNLHV